MYKNKGGGAFTTNEELLREINALPPEAKRQLEDFISFMRERYKRAKPKPASASKLEAEAFVGMWQDREDIRAVRVGGKFVWNPTN